MSGDSDSCHMTSLLQQSVRGSQTGGCSPLIWRSRSWQDGGAQGLEPLDLTVWSHREDCRDLTPWWDIGRSEALDLTLKPSSTLAQPGKLFAVGVIFILLCSVH